MGRKWKGTLAIEGVQTGDGRLIAEGALTWPEGALPLAWLKASMHGGMGGEAGVDVGTIEEGTLARGEGGVITGAGTFLSENEDAAEVVGRLERGEGPHGNAWGLSIDPDDWVVEYVDTQPEQVEDPEEGPSAIAASGRIVMTAQGVGPIALRNALAGFTAAGQAIAAAAGDPDTEDGVVVHKEDVGRFIARFTHLRIRGVTMVQVPAIEGCYLELDGEADAEDTAEPVAASATPRPAPKREYFDRPEPEHGDPLLVDQRDGGWSVPLTIGEPDEHGWRPVFGHLAHWGQCHIGIKDRCQTVPPSPSGYAEYRLHAVATDKGDVVTGPLVMGCDHASTDLRHRLSLEQARDHYANSGLAWADVTIVDGEFGPWVAGVVKEETDELTLRRIKANGWSGDWRPNASGHLDLVGIQSVPTPGFPQLRLVAGGATVEPWGTHVTYDEAGEVVALIVASAPLEAEGCGCQHAAGVVAGVPVGAEVLEDMRTMLKAIERRTRHLTKVEAAQLVASLD